MQLQTRLLITAVLYCCVAVEAPYSQIRVYDPATGMDTIAPTQQGWEGEFINTPMQSEVEMPAVRKAYKVPVTNKPLTVRPLQEPTPADINNGVAQNTQFPLGKAIIFTRVEDLSGDTAEKIQQFKKLKGLGGQVYAEEKDPREYLKMLDSPEYNKIQGVELSIDSGAYLAMRYQVREYNVLLYLDPNGTRRRYAFPGDFDKFMRHVKRFQRKSRG